MSVKSVCLSVSRHKKSVNATENKRNKKEKRGASVRNGASSSGVMKRGMRKRSRASRCRPLRSSRRLPSRPHRRSLRAGRRWSGMGEGRGERELTAKLTMKWAARLRCSLNVCHSYVHTSLSRASRREMAAGDALKGAPEIFGRGRDLAGFSVTSGSFRPILILLRNWMANY